MTQERDVVLGARLYEKTLDEIESFPSVDEAFSRNFKLIEAGCMVVIKAVYQFRTQVEMISDVGGCRPAELKMALNRVTDECCDFMRIYADHDEFLRRIHLNARTAERIAFPIREGSYRSDRRGNHLKVIK